MDQAAPAEAGAAAEKKRRPLLRRIPTPLIVTLVGIALTAWLLPAFTRQWDERQKAQEVRVTIATQIAAGTTHMIVATRKASRVRHQTGPIRGFHPEIADAEGAAANDLFDSWLEYSVKLEALLPAYFKPDLLRAFKHYNDSMEVLVNMATQLGMATQIAGGGVYAAYTARDLQKQFAMSRDRASGIVSWEREYKPAAVVSLLDDEILREENRLVGQVFASHVNGYSTTTRDLIHDLLP